MHNYIPFHAAGDVSFLPCKVGWLSKVPLEVADPRAHSLGLHSLADIINKLVRVGAATQTAVYVTKSRATRCKRLLTA